MNANPALPLVIIGVFGVAMLIFGSILSWRKKSDKSDAQGMALALIAIIVVIIVAIARSAPSTLEGKKPNKAPEPTPTSVTPPANESKTK